MSPDRMSFGSSSDAAGGEGPGHDGAGNRGRRPRWWLRGIALGLLLLISWIGAMFWFTPVQVVLDRLPAQQGLSLQALEGNLYRGILRVQAGEVTIDRLEYRLRPVALLGGHLGLDLVAEVSGGRAEARVAISPGGTLTVTDLEARLLADAPLVQQFAPFPLGGAFDLSVPQARLVEAGILSLDGDLRWMDATLVFQERVMLGQVDGEVSIAAGQLSGAVRDNGEGVLAVDLALEGHDPGTIQGTLRPRASAPDWLGQTLAMLGRPNAEGAISLRQGYRLPVASKQSAAGQ
ncbi:MAG: type II secretion system protein N [Halothiobacillaceae bacterium]